MQALLLAAGRSKRFWPLPDKNFLRFGEKTLVELQVEKLQKAGVKKIILVGNKHNIERLGKLFPKLEVLEQKDLDEGMRGAVLTAKKFLTQPTLILSTNDSISAEAIKRVVAAKKCDGAILAQEVKKYFPGGYLKVGKGKIFNIVEKPGEGKEPSNLVNVVCHLFQQPEELVKELEKTNNKNDNGYELALAQLFKKGNFIAVKNPGSWQAVKYPFHVLDLTEKYLSGVKKKISPKAKIAKTAVINGNVIIEAGVKVFDYAVITGNTVIGKNSIVGTHAFVRDSIVGENSVVGGYSEVTRSYLGEGVWLHRNYVGDSVIAGNVSFGAGAVCANLRLDEGEIKSVIREDKINSHKTKWGCAIGEAVRIGVNTSIMPGVLIGGNSLIGSGMLVEKNVENDSFYTKAEEVKVIPNQKNIPPRDSFKI